MIDLPVLRSVRERFAATKDRGAVLALVAATLVVVMISGALAVDLSALQSRGQTLQNTADAVALGAVVTWVETGNAAAATAVANDLLAQNGVGSGDGTTAAITFPSATEVDVVLTDGDPDVFLGGVVGIGDDVERGATARFEMCDIGCTYEVLIPAPFSSVNAQGNGDGYKPIPVDNGRLYAINHNNTDIVCVDRETQAACWSPVTRHAYAGGAGGGHNPEMPHTAVFGSRIWWTTSDSTGTKLFCWETVTETPCSSSYLLANRPRGYELTTKDENRGGGTVLVGNLIYAFTDDHRVHCFDPTALATCAGYPSGGKDSGLGLWGFPDNEPSDGNHGSSIDRIVDEASGKIYSTLHIPNAIGTGPPVTCPANPPDPRDYRVVIKNFETDAYITADGNDVVEGYLNGLDPEAQWYVESSSGGSVTFRNVATGRYIDSDSSNSDLDTSSSINNDDRWLITNVGGTWTIQNSDDNGYMFHQNDGDPNIDQHPLLQGTRTRWWILPFQCEDPGYTPPPAPHPSYASGTWVHCWNTLLAQPCSEFSPSAIHANASRFSGRLFFYMDTNGNPTGVCSSGFSGSISPGNFEINCVNLDGTPSSGKTSNMASFANQISGSVDTGPAAWGDPHWNEEENRVFYPAPHDHSRVYCWDFDSGWCGSRIGSSPNLGTIEDYGFFSEGNCVYGLGHNAVFWAFHAEDINADCTGSSSRTWIDPCDCNGTLAWGTLEFDVDLPLFDEFDVQVLDPAGNVVFPSGGGVHSLIHDGTIIDLNDVPTTHARLEVVVTVEAENDPWAQGDQIFTIEFARLPHLTS